MKNRIDIDLTEIIAAGNIHYIIEILMELEERGYHKLYWDGYDSYIIALGEEQKNGA